MREISKNLSYEDKSRISILHRNFDFRSTREFKLVDTYASLISHWKVFRKCLHSLLIQTLSVENALKSHFKYHKLRWLQKCYEIILTDYLKEKNNVRIVSLLITRILD